MKASETADASDIVDADASDVVDTDASDVVDVSYTLDVSGVSDVSDGFCFSIPNESCPMGIALALAIAFGLYMNT